MLQVEGLMAVGGKARHVSATAMNEHSSRSHLIFTIYTTSKHRTTGTLSDLYTLHQLMRVWVAQKKSVPFC